MVTGPWPLTCANWRPVWAVNVRTGQPTPIRCRRNTCTWCLPRNARVRAFAITESRPSRMIRLSLVADHGVPDPLEQARTRIKRIRQALKRKNIEYGEWCWTLEQNPRRTGYHAHVVQHGPYIDQGALQAACEQARAGIPYINVIKRTPGRTARYGLKGFGADGYGLKTFRAEHDAWFTLYINHGRLEHHSKGFYRVDGVKTPVKDAERAALAKVFPAPPADYIVCSPNEASRYFDSTGIVALSRLAVHHPGVVPFRD